VEFESFGLLNLLYSGLDRFGIRQMFSSDCVVYITGVDILVFCSCLIV
jgi:hypothetical protein